MSGVAIDPSGNVWIADTGNNRVLRFPASQLNTTLPVADLVLGQFNFTTNTLPNTNGVAPQLTPNLLNQPLSLAFDSQGRLYVSDAYARVLFFPSPATGGSASNILGLYIPSVNPTGLGTPNQYGLSGSGESSYCGLFTNGTNLFVIDAGNNRIVEYDQPQNWPVAPPLTSTSPASQFSPPMIAVIGQPDLRSNSANQTLTRAHREHRRLRWESAGVRLTDRRRLPTPAAVASCPFPLTSSIYTAATRLVGQLDYPYFQPNLIEGRELFLVFHSTGGDVAVDLSAGASAPHLYIADTFNNRILGFRDARNVQPGQKADLVIGQQDISGKPGSPFYRALVNSPKNDPWHRNEPFEYAFRRGSGFGREFMGCRHRQRARAALPGSFQHSCADFAQRGAGST